MSTSDPHQPGRPRDPAIGEATDPHRLEGQLRYERSFSEAVLDAMPGVFFLLHNDGQPVRWNHNLERVTGLDSSKLARTHPLELVPPEDQDRVAQAMTRVFENGSAEVEAALRGADGRYHPYRFTGRRVELAGEPFLVAFGMDITLHKQSEKMLWRRVALEGILTELSMEFLALKTDRLDDGIQEALRRIGEYTDADRCYLFQISGDGRRLDNTHEWCAEGIASQMPDLQNLAAADFIWTMEQLNRHEAVIVPATDALPEEAVERNYCEDGGICSYLLVPMHVAGELRGFLGFDSVRRERDWQRDDLKLLQLTADLIEHALVRRQLERALQHQAVHDHLTGLCNRRHFEEMLGQEICRALRYDSRFSLLMFDIDRFKAVNDHYGHGTGDAVLQKLAAIVCGRLRSTDLLARWGGEEFMALLRETDESQAAQLAEAIRSTVADSSFPGPGCITVSLGVAEYRRGEPSDQLLLRLDGALYQAKDQGRNRVVCS